MIGDSSINQLASPVRARRETDDDAGVAAAHCRECRLLVAMIAGGSRLRSDGKGLLGELSGEKKGVQVLRGEVGGRRQKALLRVMGKGLTDNERRIGSAPHSRRQER